MSLEKFEKEVQIFSHNDAILKELGKSLASENSWQIYLKLTERPYSIEGISNTLGIEISNVGKIVRKLEKARIIFVFTVTRNSKNHPVNIYQAKKGFIILPESAMQRARTLKGFRNTMKSVLRFTVVGLVSFIGWAISHDSISDTRFLLEEQPVDGQPSFLNYLPFAVAVMAGIIVYLITKKKK